MALFHVIFITLNLKFNFLIRIFTRMDTLGLGAFSKISSKSYCAPCEKTSAKFFPESDKIHFKLSGFEILVILVGIGPERMYGQIGLRNMKENHKHSLQCSAVCFFVFD